MFSFGIRSGLDPIKGIVTDVKYKNYNHFKLPISMNPLKYGKLITNFDNKYIIQIKPKNMAIIEVVDKLNKIELYKEGELKYKWIDRYIDESSFIREIGKKKYTYVNEELKLLTVEKQSKFMKPIKTSKYIDNKMLTMDLETRLRDNKHIPYCVSIYDGYIKT